MRKNNGKVLGIRKINIIAVIVLVCAFVGAITWASGYFAEKDTDNLPLIINVEGLFGKLDASQSPTGAWGTENNPYLIYNTTHLTNLYILQNSKDIKAINKDTVFQVSNPNGTPCYVGGTPENLFPIPSIGSEDFPFVSTFRGKKTANSNDFVSFNGYLSDTSVLGNIEVTAYVGQIDIGLFGNVGEKDPSDTTGESQNITTTGYIGELLLSNIRISTNVIGDTSGKLSSHPFPDDYFSDDSGHKESNHIGVLVGHAQYTRIEKISVHYPNTITGSGESRQVKANLNAFNIGTNDDAAKYTTAGGIIGFYKQIIVPDFADYPVNSSGLSPAGSTSPGFGLGVLYSVDIWNYMQSLSDIELTNRVYNLKETFEVGADKLYSTDSTLDGLTKTFFRVGVFTLVHTREALGYDRIAKLWASDADEDPSKMWTISNNGTYSKGTNTVVDSAAKKYTITQLTTSNLSVGGTGTGNSAYYYYPSSSADYSKYRYMIVVESGGIEYVLVKNGESLTTQKIDTSNFVIPANMMVYYTFRVAASSTHLGNNNKTPDGRDRFTYGSSTMLRINGTGTGNGSYSSYSQQYLLYGVTPTGSGYPPEEERPLRIFTPTSFVYSSATGSSASNEYSRLVMTAASSLSTMQRYTSSTSSAAYYLNFSVGSGFYGAASAGSPFYKVYAVDTTSGTTANFSKESQTPTGATTTFDMSKNVLQYVGTYNSNTASDKYKYDLVSLESLNLPDNLEVPITQIDSALKMADPSSYYYLGGTYYGILRNIPVAGEAGKYVYAPRGSVAVRVNNTGVAGDTSEITIIVATDPSQLVDQEITITRFKGTDANGVPNSTGTNISGILDTPTAVIALPSIPGPAVSGTSRTTPIYVKRPGDTVYRTAYPNMQTIMVAYKLTVDVSGSKSNPPTTYFLESSKGAASFVYFSVDKSATGLSNPTHKNEAYFPMLNGIDFVFDITQGANKKVATVGDDEYISSLIMPFFGVTLNKVTEQLDVVSARNLNYEITRIYVESEIKKNMMYINIIIPPVALPPALTAAQRKAYWQQINFNFFDGTYFDAENYVRINSDVVILSVNGVVIDWTDFYAI